MEHTYKNSIIPLGDYDWLVLKTIGGKLFLLSEQPIFKGYYSLSPCSFQESKLYNFLNNKFMEQLVESGVEVAHISGAGILSLAQYERYVKDRAPNPSTPFLLQNPCPDEYDKVLAINEDGETVAVGLQFPCGIRPTLFVDKDYVESLVDLDGLIELSEINPPEPQQETPVTAEIPSEPVKDTEQEETPMEEEIPTEGDFEVPEPIPEMTDEEVSLVLSKELEEPDSEDGALIEDEGDGVRSVYVFDGQYKDYAILYDEGDERVTAVIERYGLAIRAYMESGGIGNRVPMNRTAVVNRIKGIQNRWNWKEKR